MLKYLTRSLSLGSRFLCASLLTHWIFACQSTSPDVIQESGTQGPAVTADQAFASLTKEFIDSHFRRNPVAASNQGDHRFDHLWPDFSLAGEEKDRAANAYFQTALGRISPAKLSPDNLVDATILANELKAQLFTLDRLKPMELSPLAYVGVISSGLDGLISQNYGTVAARVEALIVRLNSVHLIIEAAQLRLKRPSPLETETAIAQTQGIIDLCQKGLERLKTKVPEAAPRLQLASARASKILKEFVIFLKSDLQPRSTASFRLGKELYTEKLRYDLSDSIVPDQLAQEARLALNQTLDDMYKVAVSLSPELLGKPAQPSQDPKTRHQLVRAALNKLAEDQPNNASLLKEAEFAIAAASEFIKSRKILSIPPERCQVIAMPTFNQGVAGAYSQSSGPYEATFENYIALEPPTADSSSSFYREYNRSMLTELMLHEAMPGHCLQAMHAAKNKNYLRSIFGNGPYAEGWAMYSESVMAQHGFGGKKVHLSQLKLLARAIANTLLDYGVHVQSMSETEAMHLLMHETFQEEAEATGKWRRVRLSAVQLTSYFYGYQQFTAMRKAAEKQPHFAELSFHDQLLGAGAPPLSLLRTRWGI